MKNKFFDSITTSEFKNKRLVKYILLILGLFFIFFLVFHGPTDPDLGWHLRTGQLILEKAQIPETDWYSHTMSEFPWISHEWLTDILLFKGYQIFGYLGLSLLFALIPIVVFVVLVGRIAGKNIPLEIKVLTGSLAAVVSTFFLGLRPQVLTLLGLALVLLVLTKLKENKNTKALIILPLIFLLWVNMHGGFFIGIGVLVLYLVTEGIKIRHLKKGEESQWVKKEETLTKKGWRRLLKFTIISALIILINPHGYKIFTFLKRTLTDSYAPQIIQEWFSPNFKDLSGILLAIYFIFLIEIMILRKGKIDLGQFTFFILFLILALQSSRHIPLFVIVTLPYLIKSLSGKAQEFFLSIFRTKSLLIMLIILVGFFGVKYRYLVTDPVRASFSEEKLAEQGNYPQEALDWLKENPKEGNVFNDYGWGGYLIWKAPEIKTFIDGRMAHWKEEGEIVNCKLKIVNCGKTEEKHILRDYMKVVNLEPEWEEILRKYDVKWTLIKKESSLAQALKLSQDWQEIYQDDLAIIYRIK